MKHTKFLILAAVCGAFLALAAVASAQTIKQGVATIVRIEGEARYSLGDGNWHPLVAGKVLSAGAIIQSGHDAKVDLVLGKVIEMPQAAAWPNRISLAPDSPVRGLVDYKPSVEQNMVRMTGDSTLAIDKLTVSDTGVDTVSDTELDLRKGRIFCTVKKLTATSQYLVKIPNGIAGVRGSIFMIDAKGIFAAWVHTLSVSIIGPDGKPKIFEVIQGNMYDSATGKLIPLPPQLVSLFHQISKALDTLYVEIVSFAFDRTLCNVSSTHGKPSAAPSNVGGGGGGGPTL